MGSCLRPSWEHTFPIYSLFPRDFPWRAARCASRRRGGTTRARTEKQIPPLSLESRFWYCSLQKELIPQFLLWQTHNLWQQVSTPGTSPVCFSHLSDTGWYHCSWKRMFALQCSLKNDSLARTDWTSKPCNEIYFLQGLCKIPVGICPRHWTGSFT